MEDIFEAKDGETPFDTDEIRKIGQQIKELERNKSRRLENVTPVSIIVYYCEGDSNPLSLAQK